jgi:colanic acid/amylovoran biosynthesis glycosyltransferase
LGKLDLFVLSCRKDKTGDQDGIPVVLMEAMLTGTTVISSRISGIPELVANEQTGYIVEPENPAELSEAIEYALTNNDSKTDIQQNAVNRVRRDFDLNKNVEKFATLLKE